MPPLSNRDYFFQSTASLEEQNRKGTKSQNGNGNPIRLQSKILAIQADPLNEGSVYVAQSGATVRKIILGVGETGVVFPFKGHPTGETAAVFKGPTAPLTSICFSPDGKLIFAGCWDKTIWSWDVASGKPGQRYEGHSDFVRSVISTRVRGQDLLISGGADAKVLVFSIASGQQLQVLKGHSKGIQDLAIDPISLTSDGSKFKLFTAGSDREIRLFDIPPDSHDPDSNDAEPLVVHDTNVYKLFFDADADLWTASADKTTKCLVREDAWKPNLVLQHPDFVRDVVVHEQGGWVVTACRDEEVRVWERSTGKLYHTFSGHFEEVTGLLLLGSTVVSVGIDATVRQWSLLPDDLLQAVNRAKNPETEDAQEEPKPEAMLTEEEERELAELMGED